MTLWVLVEALRASSKKTLQAREYMPLLNRTFPEERSEADGGVRLFRKILDELKVDGVIRFPAKGPTIPYGASQFPASISIASEKKDAFERPAVEWDGRLAVSGSKASRATIDDLIAMNNFLQSMKTRTVPLAPINARSLEIFGDEKRLRSKILSKTKDRLGDNLGLADFNCYIPNEYYLPYSAFPVASRTALVVENAETFHVLKKRNRENGQYRAVVFGQGKFILFGYQCLPEIASELDIDRFEYFGDIDIPGFEMPISAASELALISACRLSPAVGLYRECLSRGKPAPTDYKSRYDAQKAWDTVRASTQAWFHEWPEGFTDIEAIMTSATRVAQEWIY